MPVEQAVGAIEECGAPMVSIAGGEPLIHPEIDVIVARADRAQEVRLPVHERAAAGEEAGPLQAVAVLRLGGPHGRPARAPRRVGRARGRVRQGGRGDQARPRRAGFRVTTNTTFFTHDSPETVREVLDFLNDDLEVDEMMISPGLRVREGARPGALPRRRADAQAVQRGVRRRPAQAVAAEPQPAVPRLPRGQGRIRLHRRGGSPATRCSAGSAPAT